MCGLGGVERVCWRGRAWREVEVWEAGGEEGEGKEGEDERGDGHLVDYGMRSGRCSMLK